jgi:hypothetical protein
MADVQVKAMKSNPFLNYTNQLNKGFTFREALICI